MVTAYGQGAGTGMRSVSAREGDGMEINYVVDRLEALVNSSRRVPLSSRVMIEEEDLLALIEQLRQSVPTELKQAKRVMQERDQIIKGAQAEAEKIVTMARDRAEYMINSDGWVTLAK